MGDKITIPKLKDKSFDKYEKEVKRWAKITDTPPEKQATLLALSLPEEDDGLSAVSIRDLVMDELDENAAKYENKEVEKDTQVAQGLLDILEFMKSKLAKDDLEDCIEKFYAFDTYVRAPDQNIADYIKQYDERYRQMKKKGTTLPSEVLAFKLLRSANLSDNDQSLVKTGMNFEQRDHLFEQAKKALLKFKGQSTESSKPSCLSAANVPVKLEPAWLAQHEDALVAAGYSKTRPKPFGNRGRSRRPYQNQQRTTNPIGSDGMPLKCNICASIHHLWRECPNRQQANRQTVNYGKMEVFCADISPPQESKNYLILDSACSSTVCGRAWLDCYIDSLSPEQQKQVKRSPSKTWFAFGGGECLQSTSLYEIPAILLGKSMCIQTDVVDSPIPLLWSKKDMKEAGVKIDLKNDTVEIFGQSVPMIFTSSGHICLPLFQNFKSVLISSLVSLQDTRKIHWHLLKLHKQFSHPSYDKLKHLIEGAGQWKTEFSGVLKSICENCNTCKLFQRTPSRPIVALPLASSFNEIVCMDLKSWKSRYILHIIDMFSRLTISVFVNSKDPSVIIDSFLKSWVGAGYGIPSQGVLTDNGGEFNNDEFREVASIMGLTVLTTGAESPFQNGLCERNHAVVDIMLEKLVYENPSIPIETLLCWANMSKNALQNWNGFSSFQLVFGKNPSLPNVMTDRLPALEGKTHSEILAQHMTALHSARAAFIQSEHSERIRRALRSRVRASGEVFQRGEIVFYKREDKHQWLGPAKVIFQDGKVIFLRHGGSMVRVSPTRIVRCTSESELSANELKSSSVPTVASHQPEVETGVVGTYNLQPTAQNTPLGHAQTELDNENTSTVQGTQNMNPDAVETESVIDIREREADTQNEHNRTPNLEIPLLNTIPLSANVDSTAIKLVNNVQLRNGDRIIYSPDDQSEWKQAVVISRAGKVTGKYRNWYNIQDQLSQVQSSVDLGACDWQKIEEANVVTVPRNLQSSDVCTEAKEQELEKLHNFDVYDIVDEPLGKEVITCRWILTYKGADNQVRARLVARGFQETCEVQVDAPTVSKSVLRMFLAIVQSQGWKLKSTDIKSAFLQGKELERDVYLKPPKEARLPQSKIWRLKRCLYGLNDAARQFYNSVSEELVKLDCLHSTVDSALFLYKINGKLSGMVAMHIDDFLHAGCSQFDENVMNRLRTRFVPGKIEEEAFRYIGFDITQTSEGIEISQDDYVSKLSIPSIAACRAKVKTSPLQSDEETVFRSAVGALNWVVQGTRPDLAFEVIDLSTRLHKGTISDLVRAAKDIRKVSQCKSSIMFPPLGPVQKWKIVVFTDAAFANLNKVDSTGAHVVFLVGENGKCCPIDWRANKIRRVVVSTLAAETLSLQEGISDALYVKHFIEEILGIKPNSIPVLAFTDHKGLVNSIHSTCSVDDKLLRVNIGAIKQWLENNDVQEINHISGKRQLANSLTKVGASSLPLLEIMQTGKMPFDYINTCQ